MYKISGRQNLHGEEKDIHHVTDDFLKKEKTQISSEDFSTPLMTFWLSDLDLGGCWYRHHLVSLEDCVARDRVPGWPVFAVLRSEGLLAHWCRGHVLTTTGLQTLQPAEVAFSTHPSQPQKSPAPSCVRMTFARHTRCVYELWVCCCLGRLFAQHPIQLRLSATSSWRKKDLRTEIFNLRAVHAYPKVCTVTKSNEDIYSKFILKIYNEILLYICAFIGCR